jgi:hypothetical protein
MASISAIKAGNTGITGGLHIPNNKVPVSKPVGNTGITGGLHIPNNKVPAWKSKEVVGSSGGFTVSENGFSRGFGVQSK